MLKAHTQVNMGQPVAPLIIGLHFVPTLCICWSQVTTLYILDTISPSRSQTFPCLIKVKEYSSSWDSISELWGVTCYMGSHSVTCHLSQVNTPHLNHYQIGRYRYLIYLHGRDGRLLT